MERIKSIKDIIEQVGRIERTNNNWGEKARIIAQKYIYNIQLTENCKRWTTEIYGWGDIQEIQTKVDGFV